MLALESEVIFFMPLVLLRLVLDYATRDPHLMHLLQDLFEELFVSPTQTHDDNVVRPTTRIPISRMDWLLPDRSWARSRVSEKLRRLRSYFSPGILPLIGEVCKSAAHLYPKFRLDVVCETNLEIYLEKKSCQFRAAVAAQILEDKNKIASKRSVLAIISSTRRVLFFPHSLIINQRLGLKSHPSIRMNKGHIRVSLRNWHISLIAKTVLTML